MDNPFNVTKASEFSDEQINKYWVNIGNGKILDPKEYTPRYILGGKGCGKTHLLRYYSFPLQKLRSGSISNIIVDDKYIGIYSVLSTLDVSRFEGKNISDNQWKALFKYYFELYIGSFVLKTISEYVNIQGPEKEEEFVNAITECFLVDVKLPKNDLNSLLNYVEAQRKDIDYKIENVAFLGDFNDVEISLTSGGLIFGIPEKLGQVYKDLSDIAFIYILDEYEKLYDWQKRYINSLVWEKRRPSTFWIGARKYGYTDMHTETGEELKKGSEYYPFFIDEYYQKNEGEYDNFARKLIVKRLNMDDSNSIKELETKFQKGKDEVIGSICAKKNGNYKHWNNLSAELKTAIKNRMVVDTMENIPLIIDELKADTNNDPLNQKYKIYLFYQLWAEAKSANLYEISKNVKIEYGHYINREQSRFENIVEKYKSDFIAQLCEENGVEYYAYEGLEEFIKLSWGNPRVLLLLLKKTIEKSEVFHENPLESGGKISLRSQYIGIKETSRWYLEDAELMGQSGSNINTAINNLAKYLRLFRFSDKPTETSVCAFNLGTEDVSNNVRELLKLMELHSLLIRIVNDRKQRNSGKAEETYQLNRILAPNWNLPIARRGIADFNKNVAEAIFNYDYFKRFDSEYTSLKIRMNAPFVKKDNQGKGLQTTIFS